MRALPLVLALSALLALSACGSGDSGAPAPPAVAPGPDLEAGHVHGLAVDPTDGGLLVATHNGLFRTARGSRDAARVGDRRDLMGFTTAGPKRLVASGHPGPGQPEPADSGVITSGDGGRTWTSVALAGEVDFHVLEATGETLYGVDGASGRMLVSRDGGRRWAERTPPGAIFDLAVDPRDPRRAIAAGAEGLFVTRDLGRTWRSLPARLTGLLEWPAASRLYLATADGIVHRSADAGRKFAEVGAAGGQLTAFSADGDELHVALTDGQVRRSSDGGASFSTRVTLDVPE